MKIFILTYIECLQIQILSLSLYPIKLFVMIDIDRILKSKRISKTDVAKKMQLSRESLYRILSGNPTLENLQKLSNALDVSIGTLLGEPNNDEITCPHCGGKIKVSVVN